MLSDEDILFGKQHRGRPKHLLLYSAIMVVVIFVAIFASLYLNYSHSISSTHSTTSSTTSTALPNQSFFFTSVTVGSASCSLSENSSSAFCPPISPLQSDVTVLTVTMANSGNVTASPYTPTITGFPSADISDTVAPSPIIPNSYGSFRFTIQVPSTGLPSFNVTIVNS